MNFIVSSNILFKHLQNLTGVLTTNNSLPILDNFLFEILDDELVVSASDSETTIHTRFNVESKELGKVCIPAKTLLDILKNLPDQPCTFSISDSTFMVELTYDNGKAQMAGINGLEYPNSPKVNSVNSIVLDGDILLKAINKTIFASGNDDLRPVMSGVYCQFSASEMIFVATDAHKLVRYKRTDIVSDVNGSFILPKKPLNVLKSSIRSGEQVKIDFNESNAVFSFSDIMLTCRLVDGKYPNYEAVIPKENPNVLLVDRLHFLSCMKRVYIFSNKSTHLIKLKITGSELAMSSEDIDFSNEAYERLTCHYSGDDMEIGFNGKFLMEMLSNLDATNVEIQMSVPSRAGLLVPSNHENEHEDILMLVMPVILNR
jgi:DNA polymerase-3 subunit beta